MMHRSNWKRLALASIAMLLVMSAWTAYPSRAAVPTLETIRVALFLQLPGRFDSTTAAATFSSPGGLGIGVRDPGGAQQWFEAPAADSVRFAVDDYKVKLFESTNFNQALAVYQRLQSARAMAYLTSVTKSGRPHYQVLEGTYTSAAEAEAAVARWSADSTIAGLLGGFRAQAQGPWRLESAPFESKTAAQAAAVAFGGAGLDAFVAVRASVDGKVSYSVMVGAETSEEGLQALRVEASKAPGGTTLTPVDRASAYLIVNQDHSISAQSNVSHEMYLFPAGDMKVWISPLSSSPIGLTERSNRSYRGSFELSAFGGKLAVVNELPFEQYLYSVVAVEMYPSWPVEALKAQAVAARTYALNKGFGFQIAHVVDTTLSQAYYGVAVERPSTTEAVDATKGEVALYEGKLIESIYSSNSGGMTADATEAWNNAVPYLQPVASPDHTAEAGLQSWHLVMLPDGRLGYIREDLIRDTGRKTAAGSRILESTADAVNIRRHPVIQDAVPVIMQIQSGTRLVELEKVTESNPMNWTRGPFTGEELQATLNSRTSAALTAPVTSLEISKRGPSGRAVEVKVNGQAVPVSSPDALRSALGVGGSLPSTMFAVEETGKLSIQGAGGNVQTRSDDSRKLYVMGADGKSGALTNSNLFVLDGDGQMRAATKDAAFRFVGKGNGHGVGMSQFGALGLAQQGYDYEYILKYYYKGITIAKE